METQTKSRIWWKTPWLWAGLVVVVMAAAVAAGLPVLSADSAVVPEAENVVVLEETTQTVAVAAQPEIEIRSGAAGMQEKVPEVVADAPSSDNCIECHTDEELLKEIAEEPEEVHSEEAAGEG